MYLPDTSVCIEFLRGRMPEALEMLRENDVGDFALPALVEAELHLSIVKRDSRKQLQTFETFLKPFEIIPFDSECAKIYAAVRVDLERHGCRIGPNDLVIAAIALTHNAVLVTRNEDEFKRIPHLQLEVWDVIDA